MNNNFILWKFPDTRMFKSLNILDVETYFWFASLVVPNLLCLSNMRDILFETVNLFRTRLLMFQLEYNDQEYSRISKKFFVKHPRTD